MDYKGPFKDIHETLLGKKVWEFLKNQDTVSDMKTASRLGRPAIEGISATLIYRFKYFGGPQSIFDERFKQYIGHAITLIMNHHDFIVLTNNIKANCRLFSRAKKYYDPHQCVWCFANSNAVEDLSKTRFGMVCNQCLRETMSSDDNSVDELVRPTLKEFCEIQKPEMIQDHEAINQAKIMKIIMLIKTAGIEDLEEDKVRAVIGDTIEQMKKQKNSNQRKLIDENV